MSEEIKIEYVTLSEELEKLNKAIAEFEPYSKDFVSKVSKKLDTFNSDFISKMQSALDNMTDTKAPELVENLKEYSLIVKSISDTFSTVDKEVGMSYNN